MLGEPPDSNFRNMIHHTAYPVREQGGLMWFDMVLYLADGDPPGLPMLDVSVAEDDIRIVENSIERYKPGSGSIYRKSRSYSSLRRKTCNRLAAGFADTFQPSFRKFVQSFMVDTVFLGIPYVDVWIFSGLILASFCTAFVGAISGAGAGLILLTIMAFVFPPTILVPVHTVVQLGTGSSRVIIMWRYVMRGTLLPFLIGAGLGAALGAQIVVALPTAILQGMIGTFVLIVTWLPKFGRAGALTRQYALLGFVSTFLGMFISATAVILAPFVAGASADRRNYAATVAALMVIGHIAKLAAFGLLGVALAAYIPLMLSMILTGILGTWIGSRVLNHIPEKIFRISLQILLTCLALRLIWIGLSKMA
jgi:uncharacterized membrane protein YfcA